MAELADRLVDFSVTLREHGLPVSTAQTLAFCEAASHVGPTDLYWAGRTTLTTACEHLPLYEQVFHAFWGGAAVPRAPRVVERPRLQLIETADDPSGEDLTAPLKSGRTRASGLDAIRDKCFPELTDAELAQLERTIRQIRIATPTRRSRRTRTARRGELDLRRMVRLSARTGGEPIRRAWRRPTEKPRRVVFILDVSASMAPYSRALLLFAHAALRAHSSWNAFCFSTRLSRISQPLLVADPNAALADATERVDDWDTGTRIGDSLEEFLAGHGDRGMARGAIVVICSDGLDVGDPAVLSAQMRRLARLSHRVVWVNPLNGMNGYEPLAGGMQAALPHVDDFVSGRNLASLEQLAELFASL
jgi:uncharacterized protein with von Willebrand factor type A (vWA) domain